MSYTEWQIFDSSSIAAGRYDADSSVLEIQFNEGKIYKYVDVPRDTWLSLCRADSKGSYFQSQIRDRYRHEANNKPNDEFNNSSEAPQPNEKKKKYNFYELDFWEVQEFALEAINEKNWERAAVAWDRLEVLIDQKIKCHRAMAYCINNRAVCLWWKGERERALKLMYHLHEYVAKKWSIEDADSGEISDTYKNREIMENYIKTETIFSKQEFTLVVITNCFFNSTIPDQIEEPTKADVRPLVYVHPAENPGVSPYRSTSGCASIVAVFILTVASLYFI